MWEIVRIAAGHPVPERVIVFSRPIAAADLNRYLRKA